MTKRHGSSPNGNGVSPRALRIFETTYAAINGFGVYAVWNLGGTADKVFAVVLVILMLTVVLWPRDRGEWEHGK